MAPIPAELCIAGRDLTEPRLTPGGELLGWVVAHAGEAVIELTSGAILGTAPGVRAGRGLGGGAWCFTPDAQAVVYVGADGNLWRQPVTGGAAVPLTAHGPERVSSGPQVSADGRWVVHVVDQAEVWALDLHGGAARRLDDGRADFCLDPWVATDGTVQWMAWDVPDMPWDHSRVQWADLHSSATGAWRVAGCVQQPRQMPDGTRLAVRDDSGWLNVWLDDQPLLGAGGEPCEHAGPTWGPGQRSYAWSPDGGQVAFTRNERGFGRLCVVERAIRTIGTVREERTIGTVREERTIRTVREVGRGVHGQLSWEGARLAAVRSGARTPTQVVLYDTRTWECTVVAQGPAAGWGEQQLVEPQAVQVAGIDGAVLHARLYAADDPDGRLIVWLHGGPTDQWQVAFMPRVAYWRSRGWSVLVPDHRGSTGHGREYQQALREGWGVVDVDDTVAVTDAAHAAGWGLPARTAIIGGSAGGFTALGALARRPGLYAAAVLLYPVTDLVDMAERSHRFERHYTDSLVGALPAARALYQQRSPVLQVDRLTTTPLLILHGDLDAVVPLEQSQVLAGRVNVAGGRAELHVYAGEGHGFRQPPNQRDEYARIGEFLTRHVPIGSQP